MLVLPDGAGPASEVEKVYARNQWLKPRKRAPAQIWRIWAGVQCVTRRGVRWVNSEAGYSAGEEATVKDCGVAVAMLPG